MLPRERCRSRAGRVLCCNFRRAKRVGNYNTTSETRHRANKRARWARVSVSMGNKICGEFIMQDTEQKIEVIKKLLNYRPYSPRSCRNSRKLKTPPWRGRLLYGSYWRGNDSHVCLVVTVKNLFGSLFQLDHLGLYHFNLCPAKWTKIDFAFNSPRSQTKF